MPCRLAPASTTIPPMIDLKQLRADPQRFKQGARDKGIDVDIDRLVQLDADMRSLNLSAPRRTPYRCSLT